MLDCHIFPLIQRTGQFKTGVLTGHDPEGKVLGIVGMGGIGRVSRFQMNHTLAILVTIFALFDSQALARRAIGFSMKILYHNRHPLKKNQLVTGSPPFDLSPFVTYVNSLDSLLSQSDVVSLNLPLNAETAGSFGAREFNLMKPDAILVNTARGAIVDEEALLAALDSGRVSSLAFMLT